MSWGPTHPVDTRPAGHPRRRRPGRPVLNHRYIAAGTGPDDNRPPGHPPQPPPPNPPTKPKLDAATRAHLRGSGWLLVLFAAAAAALFIHGVVTGWW